MTSPGQAAIAASTSGTGSTWLVTSLASLAAFPRYAANRSAGIGHAPTRFCQASSSSERSGNGCAAAHRRIRSTHSPGISASTASRARTSSERLVSWVDSVVIVAGQEASRLASAAWNSAGATPNRAGSPPTSLSATNRFQR